MSRRCGRDAGEPGWSYCVQNAGHEGVCVFYSQPNEKAFCGDGSCGHCGGCYEVMREEFNRAADERDQLKKDLKNADEVYDSEVSRLIRERDELELRAAKKFAKYKDDVLVLLNHLEDLLSDDAWQKIDNDLWNAVSMGKLDL